MEELDEEDREFVEKVIDQNREGLERLAEEKDAEKKRADYMRKVLRDFYRKLKRRNEDKEASFTEIER
jgi:hypothetical protein